MKKYLSLALLAAILLQTAACGGTDAPAADDTTVPETTTAPETTAPYVPKELDYGGANVSFFIREEGGSMPEFYVEEQTGEIINDAIYDRNRKVEEDLNVKFTYREEKNSWNERKTFAQMISQSILAGDAAYDIVAGYSMSLATLAASGMLCDMMETEYLDFEKPWWSDNLTEQATVNGKLYIATGDISTFALYYMFGTYFNKDMITKFNLESPYDLVESGKWTLDKMISMSKGVYQDLNGDDKKDEQDQHGMAIPYVCIDQFYWGSGLHTTELDKDGTPFISPDLSSEKTVDLVAKLCTLFHSDPDAWIVADGIRNPFLDGRALFTNQAVSLGNSLRDVKFGYGMVPTPKADEKQEDYVTIMSFPYTLYGIPLDAKDPDMSSAVLESLAAEGYYNVSPALFEVVMKVKYAQDDQASAMYDIIKAGMCFEFGRVYTDDLGSLTYGMFRNGINGNDPNWMSRYESNKTTLESKMAAVLESFN